MSLAGLTREVGQKLDSGKGGNLSYTERLKFAVKLFQGGSMMRNFSDPKEARIFARDYMKSYFRELEASGIDVNFYGFPYEEEQDSDVGQNERNKLMLYLCNHQIFGIEALAAFNLAGTNTRVLVKDELLKIPLFGSGLTKIDPIAFNRDAGKLSEIRRVHEQIRMTIQDRLQPVFIFPEGTRSEDGGLKDFHHILYAPAVKAIKRGAFEQQKIGVITADTHVAFPYKLSPKLLYQTGARARRTPINFKFDILELNPSENIADLNDRVHQKIEDNLRGFLLEKLGHVESPE